MTQTSITLFPHQIAAFKDIINKSDKYKKEAQEYLSGPSKAHCMDAAERQNDKLISAIKWLILHGNDITCEGKTVGEVASLYNLHVYKGGYVDNNSDSLYSGNLTGNEIVSKVTSISPDGYIFLELCDGRTVVIVGVK